MDMKVEEPLNAIQRNMQSSTPIAANKAMKTETPANIEMDGGEPFSAVSKSIQSSTPIQVNDTAKSEMSTNTDKEVGEPFSSMQTGVESNTPVKANFSQMPSDISREIYSKFLRHVRKCYTALTPAEVELRGAQLWQAMSHRDKVAYIEKAYSDIKHEQLTPTKSRHRRTPSPEVTPLLEATSTSSHC